ncbi:MAG: tetratricopeptide repeat protein, partial [Desulfobacteraceae bacterium]|nr:tetratricopeptide repeat protein [Desulfobacteraceae bacterium]
MSSLYENSLKDHLAEMKKFITLILLLTISVLLLHPRTSYCFEDSFELGIKYLNSGSYEDAIKAFSTTIETIPHDFVAISNRGIAFFYISKYDEAIKDYTRAITISPGFADAYCNRGVAWAAKGNTDNAIADYTKAIEINPNYSEAYYNRAASWAAKGNYGRAIADYTKDIESNPVYSKISEKNVSGYNDIIQRFSEVHFNRGLIFNAKGNYDPAISDFEKAIE